MGTSSSYKGSSGAASRKIRDGVTDWTQAQTVGTGASIPEGVVAQALNIPRFSRTTGTGGGGAGGGGAGGSSGGHGKQSGPQRSAHAYASTASRAAGLARAFREGDREALAKAGLDLDALSQMPSRAEMVRAIIEAVCDADMGSDIPSEEQREIAAHLLDWMLDTDTNTQVPDAAATAEHAIGLIVAEIFLSEAGEYSSEEGVSRDDFINTVYETSMVLAAKANLGGSGASQEAIDKAIEKGLRFLRRTYAKGQD